MAAFIRAVEVKADMIELDVQMSKDGELVVFHDHDVKRTTNGSGYVKDLTVKELLNLDAGRWFSDQFAGEKIPLLEEVLVWAKDRIPLSIEIKPIPSWNQPIEERLVELLVRKDMVKQVQVMSFDHQAVYKVKCMNSEVMTSIISASRMWNPIGYAKRVGATILNQPWYFLTPEFIEQAHDEGLLISGSLIDDPDIWKEVHAWGIDLVDTNYPERLLAVTKKRVDLDHFQGEEQQ
ncbi:glycerophosphoryl diester phosphodiesterase [Effusibacillus lacus]|nr:glycerophosphoryl diester phosphodiesterase [Effusibacillus lacus]